MYTGIVETGSLNGFKFVLFAFEVVRSSGAVSPMILATPRTTAVINPVFAVGKTMRIVTRARLDPRATAASLTSLGTSLKTSSAVLATVGNIKIA